MEAILIFKWTWRKALDLDGKIEDCEQSENCLNSNLIALRMVPLTNNVKLLSWPNFLLKWNEMQMTIYLRAWLWLAKWNRENLFSIQLQHPLIMKSLKDNCWRTCFGKGLQGLLKIMLCNLSCWSNFRAIKDWEANIATQPVPLHYLLTRLYFHR